MPDPKEVDKIIDQLHQPNEADGSLIEALNELDLERDVEKNK